MNGKRLGILGGCLALIVALAMAFSLGAAYGGGSGMTIVAPQAQQFAAAVPASSGNTGTLTNNAPAPATSGAEMTTEQIVDRVGPAVVTVVNKQTYTGSRRPGSAQPTQPGGGSQPVDTGLGSGVVFDKAGYILTNNHVVDGATAIDVELADGTRVDGTLVGRDPRNDVAVVKIDPAKVTAVADLGDSAAVKPGQRVVAIGSPEGYENTITEGIVSGVNRQVDSYIGLIQTDAAINHGNSGGPLLNASAQVIGLNTLGIRDNNAQGLNFAIPINMVKDAASTIISKGNGAVISAPRSYLGVQIDPRNTADGAHVQTVNQGTPAAKAGLQTGDIITAVNGTKLDNKTQLGNVLSTLKPGDTVTLTVNRGGNTQTLTATLVQYPANP